MPYPPGRWSPLPLLFSLVALVVAASATPAHAHPSEESPGFYADMLDRHDGVFVSEELAGHLDRWELADDLRARVHEEGVPLDVLVVAHPTDADLDWLADEVHHISKRSVVVFSPHTNHVHASALRAAGLPSKAADYTSYTGAYPEDPRDQLDRLLRAASYSDLDERTARARTEFVRSVGGEPEPDSVAAGFPSQRWLTVTWPSSVGFVVSGVCAALVVGGGVTVLRRRGAGAR
ncbi:MULTISPECIES: hypothetical protein [Nocardiopsis]|uniref:hypothetical protein n=1 Tax=Nocardiopsis TaxID=2013 RepID=UPI000345A940|nr:MULTISPECIES: hypothetical protein [Nocardiopsis]PWV49404.1 hypothetical protein BDW27_109258 [Nocardiopsis sp. L17-MgMaSL7]